MTATEKAKLIEMYWRVRQLDEEILKGHVVWAPRLGADPRVCPRCCGNVMVEKGAHYCLQCGWRQEHRSAPFSAIASARALFDSEEDEDD